MLGQADITEHLQPRHSVALRPLDVQIEEENPTVIGPPPARRTQSHLRHACAVPLGSILQIKRLALRHQMMIMADDPLAGLAEHGNNLRQVVLGHIFELAERHANHGMRPFLKKAGQSLRDGILSMNGWMQPQRVMTTSKASEHLSAAQGVPPACGAVRPRELDAFAVVAACYLRRTTRHMVERVQQGEIRSQLCSTSMVDQDDFEGAAALREMQPDHRADRSRATRRPHGRRGAWRRARGQHGRGHRRHRA
mmetsp:Transcript_127617/g.367211  ORF Transcript_127617/g.367211 Transcript_127617/m.367211 type:complete len:252 (-) Transcript_127617:118-873(-)